MKLYITEKKSVALAMIPALGKKSDGAGGLSFVTNNGDVVTWLSGHVLELVDAKDYDAKYSTWKLDNLPILPHPFKLRPTADKKTPSGIVKNDYTRKILANALNLIGKATEICLATDPDPEGELLGREVIEYANFQGKLTRILPTSLEVADMVNTIKNEFPASQTENIGKAGLGRSHIDWIIGINSTVGLTTYNADKVTSPLHCGRVQTAIISILHMNHIARATFQPQPTYKILLNGDVGGVSLTLNYTTRGKEKELLNPKDENYDSSKAREFVERLAAMLNGKDGVVSSCQKKRGSKACPKGYSLGDLQIDVNKKFGITASETLEAVQYLYDHHFTTYPRTDNNYFPEEAHNYAGNVIQNIKTTDGLDFANQFNDIDPSHKSVAWNTSMFDNHHAIMPTRKKAPFATLTPTQQKVYELICRRYIMQFMPDYLFDETSIEVTVDDRVFKTTGTITVDLGWKKALIATKLSKGAAASDDEDDDDEKSEGDDKSLPLVNEGTIISNAQVVTSEGKTNPPKPLTEASLLSILKQPSKYIDSKELRDVLKQREQGIGRESTRATILSQMAKNQYYKVVGKKNFELTEKGVMLAEIAPPFLLNIALTAKLELDLWRVEKGELTYDDVMSIYKEATHQIINSIREGKCSLKKSLAKTAECVFGCNGRMVLRQGANGAFWKCASCLKTTNDKGGNPAPRAESSERCICPICSQQSLSKFNFKDSKNKQAWYCKPCKLVLPDNNGSPMLPLNSCEKCQSHLNFGHSSAKAIDYFRCSNSACSQLYESNNQNVGQIINSTPPKTTPCPKCNQPLYQRINRADQSKFWVHANQSEGSPKCSPSFTDADDRPFTAEYSCPECKGGKLTRKSFKGRAFWSCSNFRSSKKQCKFTAKDKDGKPDLPNV